MSRVGKKTIIIPAGVTVTQTDHILRVKGAKTELTLTLHPHISVTIGDGVVDLEVTKPDLKSDRALWGLFRNLIKNMIDGVTSGFSKQLEVNGIGYRVVLSGKKLVMELGFSHPVEFLLPEGIEAAIDKNLITLKGADKQLLGETTARIRSIRPPEPYKGKGIKYVEEVIRRKAGKAVKTGAA